MAERMSNGLVKVYTKDGVAIEVYPIDARELVKSGDHYSTNPKLRKKKKASTPAEEREQEVDSYRDSVYSSGIDNHKFEDQVDLDSLAKSELVEYAKEKFGEELNLRFGEPRMRVEIQKLQELHAQRVTDEDEDEDEVIDRDDE